MIRDGGPLQELERRFERETLAGLSYPEALRLFGALWAEALLLNPQMGDDWQEDLAPDLAIARAVNGLPPSA